METSTFTVESNRLLLSPGTTVSSVCLSDTDSISSNSRPSSLQFENHHHSDSAKYSSCDESSSSSSSHPIDSTSSNNSIDCSAVTELDNMNLTTLSNIQTTCQHDIQPLSTEEYHATKSNPIAMPITGSNSNSNSNNKQRPTTMKKKTLPTNNSKKTKRNSQHYDNHTNDEDIPSPDEIKYVQYLQKCELMIVEMNKMNNVYDFNEIYNFHEKYCHSKDSMHSTIVSLTTPNESQPMILVYRDVKGFAAMASYSAASVLAIPDGTNVFKNPDVRVYNKDTTPYLKENPSLQPKINQLGVDETNYGYVIFADYYTSGTKLYEVEVVEEESLLESQNVIESAVLTLQNLSVQKSDSATNDQNKMKETSSTTGPIAAPSSVSNNNNAVSYTNLVPIDTGNIFCTEKYSQEITVVASVNNASVLDKASNNGEDVMAAARRAATINRESNICIGAEGSMVSESGKRYVAKSIEGMPVFISTETARFRRGPKLANPIKITLKGALEIHMDYNEKIRKIKYKFTH